MRVYLLCWKAAWETGIEGVFTSDQAARAWLDVHLRKLSEPARGVKRSTYRVCPCEVDVPSTMPRFDWPDSEKCGACLAPTDGAAFCDDCWNAKAGHA